MLVHVLQVRTLALRKARVVEKNAHALPVTAGLAVGSRPIGAGFIQKIEDNDGEMAGVLGPS